jgi:hypothetical protein
LPLLESVIALWQEYSSDAVRPTSGRTLRRPGWRATVC